MHTCVRFPAALVLSAVLSSAILSSAARADDAAVPAPTPVPSVPAGESPYPPPAPLPPPAQQLPPAATPTSPAGESAVTRTILGGLKLRAELGQGVTVATDDDRYSLNIRARFQVRDTVLDTEGLTGETVTHTWTNDANIKTVRLIFDGHLLSKNIDYFVQLALGGSDSVATTSQTPSPIYDAFLDFTWLRDLNVRVGQFFVPFDRARTIREYALQFVDRQQVVNELALNRGLGIKLFSDNLFGVGGRLSYALGAFYNDGINNFTNTVPGLLSVARIAVKPFGIFDDDIEGDLLRLPRPRLAVGGAVAWNQHTSLSQSTFGTLLPQPTTTTLSSSGVLTETSQTAGTIDYLHADADLVFKYRGLSFLGEFLYRQADPGFVRVTTTTETITPGSAEKPATYAVKSATTNGARNARGYLVQGGYLFTDFFEVVGRFDQIIPVGAPDPTLVSLANQTGREGGGGINFYLHHHLVKLQADYFHYWGPDPDHAKDQIRFQVDCSI